MSATPSPGDLIWVDGKILSRDQFFLDPFDEGLLFGRGLFETTRTFERRPWLWNAHLTRLIRSAQQLAIPVNSSKLPTRDQVANFARSFADDVMIRLNVSAGSTSQEGSVWMTARALPLKLNTPFQVITYPHPIHSDDAFLTIKSFHYGTRWATYQYAREQLAQSSLLFDLQGRLLESNFHNVFVLINKVWHTPRLDLGLLAGTVREMIVNTDELKIIEAELTADDLLGAESMLMTNSGVGVQVVDNWKHFGQEKTFETDGSAIDAFVQQISSWQVPNHPSFDGVLPS